MNDRIVSYMNYHPVRTQRGLEILAGIFPWTVITFLIAGSIFIPEVVAYFIIVFNVYWLYRSLQLIINSTSGYLNIKATEQVDWEKRLQTDSQTKGRYKDIYHVVMIPNVKEPMKFLERNLESLLVQNFPHKNLIVVPAMEERVAESKERAAEIMKRFKGKFGRIIPTFHPLMPGETIGKHSNENYAVRTIKKILVDEEHIPIENITVTTSDIDCVFHRQYFSLLTYKFLTSKKPFNSFFQAPLFMYNNLHRLPFLTRAMWIMGCIYYLSMLRKASGRFMNFSTYSMSLKMLETIDYWDIDVIPEDWHINLKAYFTLKGEVATLPMYVPVYIDAAEADSSWATYKNSYEQLKRWAWGIVDAPYVIKMFFRHPEISLFDRLMKLSLTLEWHFLWSTSWFLVTLGATIPTLLNPVFARTTLGYNLSQVSSSILTICLLGILTVTIIDVLLNPQKKRKFLAFLHPFTYLQWVVLPVTGLIFGILPGLESQTRLMLGKDIVYKVTKKV